ncbi:hypothetical protein LTR92_002258 [Exophiala xenobiotica]|nr:hypothetical protein LTR92_002258 [Exophiala xenobiotica]
MSERAINIKKDVQWAPPKGETIEPLQLTWKTLPPGGRVRKKTEKAERVWYGKPTSPTAWYKIRN